MTPPLDVELFRRPGTGLKYGVLAVVGMLLTVASVAQAAPRIASRTNFGCYQLSDAVDMLTLVRNRDDDGILSLVRANRCVQLDTDVEITVLERAIEGGESFLRVRLYVDTPAIGRPVIRRKGKGQAVDIWYPEKAIGGAFGEVPTRERDEESRGGAP